MTADYIIGMCLSIFTSLSSLLTITSRWRRQEFMARLYNVLSWINRFFQLQNTVYSSLFSFSFSIIRCIWVPADISYTLNFHHISNTLLTLVLLRLEIVISLDRWIRILISELSPDPSCLFYTYLYSKLKVHELLTA